MATDVRDLRDNEQEFQTTKRDVHRELIEQMDMTVLGTLTEDERKTAIREQAQGILSGRRDLLLSLSERSRLQEEILDEFFGLGPLEPLVADPTISDILVNGYKTVYVEQFGTLRHRPDITFRNEQHLIQIVQRICERVGRRVDEASPIVDARLADGSRVNAIVPPLALDGTLLSIRKFGDKPLLAKDLIRYESVTQDMLNFLSACVDSGMNCIISGGTGSGKTTLLNLLSSYIPPDERIATIEDAAELRLQQPHVARMETRPAGLEGTGAITMRDLVKNSLRMRPDRIVIGECRGSEAFDMLQAMNTGHEGSLTTLHANTPRDAIGRLEMLVATAVDMPIWIIRRQIASAIHIVVQATRLRGGKRKIIAISELTGMEGDIITMHDLFVFHQTGVDENRCAVGYHTGCGVRPRCYKQLEENGHDLPQGMFEERPSK